MHSFSKNRKLETGRTRTMAASSSKEDILENLLSLKETLECPVCLMLPKQTPIYQCDNGHIVCKTCHARLDTCPQCRKALGKNRNLFAENFLVSFMKPCLFELHGCPVKLLPDHGADHLVGCVYREISCFFPNCQELVSVKQIETHLDVAHRQKANHSPAEGCYTGRLKILASGPELGPRNSPTIISFHGKEFLVMKFAGMSDLRHFWVYGPGTPDEMSKFIYSIQLWSHDEKVKVACQDRVVSMEKPVVDVTNDGDGLILTEVGKKKLTQSGLVKYEITITAES